MLKAVHLREAFKLALSITLFYWLSLSMDWSMPKYGALAIVLISLGTAGASFQKGLLRLVGTTFGLLVGMVLLALFAQDRVLTLVFLAGYLVFIAYFMQGSRYLYAWFVAGFLPPLVWATTYGDVNNTFHYASFRYLETAAGIIIYTLVTTLLWPITAGRTLDAQGSGVWSSWRAYVATCRRGLHDETWADDATALRTKVVGGTTQMLATLSAAYADTPSVMTRKPAWEALRAHLAAFGHAVELWRENVDDVRGLDLARLMPALGAALDRLEARLARIEELWQARAADAEMPAGPDDDALLAALDPGLDPAAVRELRHFDRAALLSFVQEIRAIDAASRGMLGAMRVIADLDPMSAVADLERPPTGARPALWDPARFATALVPAACFVVTFVFWMIANPPTGPMIPAMGAIFSLVVLFLMPIGAFKLLLVVLVCVWVAVAPVYFLVMPHLQGGFDLLALVFGFVFVFGVIGAKAPAVKLLSLALFVMLTDIRNDQVYSFLGLANGALMLGVPMAIIGVVQMLTTPVHPEQVLLGGVRRFFRGCARITGELAVSDPETRMAREPQRRRLFMSAVQPVPARLRSAGAGRPPVERLLTAMQSIAFRLQALELATDRLAQRSVERMEPLIAVGRQVRGHVQDVLEQWSRLERADAPAQRAAFRELAREVERQLDESEERPDDATLADLYAMLGCARGLVRAVAEAQEPFDAIEWERWTEARF
jgi:hypothetical protein